MLERRRISKAFWIALSVLVTMACMGLAAPWLAPYDPDEQTDPAVGKLRPPLTRLAALRLEHDRWLLAERVERRDDRLILHSRQSTKEVSIHDVLNLDAEGRPTDQRFFWMGSDELGRDVWSRWLYGARISFWIALLSIALASTVGITIGSLAALGGRWLDLVLMRIVDGLLAFPWIFLLIALTAFVPASVPALVLILGGTGWMSISRLARGEIQQLREKDFVRAARGLGMTETSVFLRHILPNIWTPLAVAMTLRIGYLILVEASLSFLGLGVQPPQASWGNMIAAGRNMMSSAWWVLTFPALSLVITVVSIHWVGDHLRDLLDPRFRSSEPG